MKSNVCVKSSLPSNDVVKWLFGFNTVLLNISLTDELKNVELIILDIDCVLIDSKKIMYYYKKNKIKKNNW